MGDSEKKIFWIAWSKVTSSFKNAGIQIGSLMAQNLVLLAKWHWRFRTESASLWKMIIQSLHGAKGGLNSINKFGRHAGTWRNIIKISSDFESANIPLDSLFQRKIGCGSTMAFWWDSWLCSSPLKDTFPALYSLDKKKKCNISEKLIMGSNNSCTGLKISWRRSPTTDEERQELEDLTRLCTNYSFCGVNDQWSWAYDPVNGFTVVSIRSAYEEMIAKNDGSIPFSWINLIPSKVNLTAWRVLCRRLPTCANLSKCGISIISDLCLLCDNEVETEDHLFLGCNFSRRVLLDLCGWWSIDHVTIPTLEGLFCWGNLLKFSKNKQKIFQGVIYVYLWSIWGARNIKRFNKPVAYQNIPSSLRALTFFWMKHKIFKDFTFSWSNWCSDPLSITYG